MRQGRLNEALRFSEKEWQLRIDLWPAIETSETKRLDRAAKESGADFSRVCGAGGGGVMAVFAPPEKRNHVIKALKEAGGLILEAGIAEHGLVVKDEG
jgi:D-glycero-alpha-D-manno-heptose-7-phosphate kinase